MDESDQLQIFLHNLFSALTNTNVNEDDSVAIFRRNNNKLDISGDISFPLNISAWKKYINSTTDDEIPILRFMKHKFNLEICNFLITSSKYWNIKIIKCSIEYDKLGIFLDRPIVFENIITCILSQKSNYGYSKLKYPAKLEINLENNDNTVDLTHLRMKLLKDIINNLLKITGNEQNDSSEIIYLTNKSKSDIEAKKIVCGVVVSNKFGKKNTVVTSGEYYNKRKIDMRLMAQHKYGIRVNSEPGWPDFFEKLGNAAVIIDLIHVKHNRPIVINIENPTALHSKGASFILYNCARLSMIFKQFDQKTESGIYPKLPEIKHIDFSLLNQSEEWEIMYVYLLQYPQMIKSCIKDIYNCKLNIHNLCIFLDSLCSLFSVYYRRVRILTEPRIHLFPVLYARIYLLKAIQTVLHNALDVLNIPPVKQM